MHDHFPSLLVSQILHIYPPHSFTLDCSSMLLYILLLLVFFKLLLEANKGVAKCIDAFPIPSYGLLRIRLKVAGVPGPLHLGLVW